MCLLWHQRGTGSSLHNSPKDVKLYLLPCKGLGGPEVSFPSWATQSLPSPQDVYHLLVYHRMRGSCHLNTLIMPKAVTPRPCKSALGDHSGRAVWTSLLLWHLLLLVTPLFLGSHRPAPENTTPRSKGTMHRKGVSACEPNEPHCGQLGATSGKNREKKTRKALREKTNRYSFPSLPVSELNFFRVGRPCESSRWTTTRWECGRTTKALAGSLDQVHGLHTVVTQGTPWLWAGMNALGEPICRCSALTRTPA